MTPILGVMMLAVVRSYFRFLNAFIRELIRDNFASSDLQMIWFIHRKFYLPSGLVYHCFSSVHRPFSYSSKESGSSDIFIHVYTRGSIE